MKILSEGNLAEIAAAIASGRVAVFPTETSYGLGGDAANQAAVERIFRLKGRKENKSLLVVVPTVAEAKKYLVWNKTLDTIAKKYWPGAVTAVGEYTKEGRLAKGVVAENNTLALRVTKHPLLKSIAEKLGRPLVATSANRSGQGECYDAKEVAEIFEKNGDQPDYLLDYGRLPHQKPTTIVDALSARVIRQGEVTVEL